MGKELCKDYVNCVSLVNNLKNNSPGGWVASGNTYTYSPKYSPRQKEVSMKDIKDIHITTENGKLEIELDHERMNLSNITDMDIHLDCNVKTVTIDKHELMFMR